MKHEMPALTDEQRERQIARALAVLEADENDELYYWTDKDVLNAQIALAALTAESVGHFVRRRFIHSHPSFEGSPDAFILYTAPPVPALKSINHPKTECIGWVKEAIQEHDEKWRQAIRAAGYEVKDA